MKLLVIEDDRMMANMVKNSLMAEKHVVETAEDGADGSFLGRSYQYDAIVLDYSLPKKDGLAVCREIRASGRLTPIIFLSATDDTATKVAALNQGADDYMTKPFALNELSARLRALSRRPAVNTPTTVTVGTVTIDTDSCLVTCCGHEVHLTRKEFNILEYLMRHAGTAVSRAQLLERVWTADNDPFSNTVETHVSNVRRKLAISGAPTFITTVPSRGYQVG